MKNISGFAKGKENPRRLLMRLWLKCPDCQAKNFLAAQVCAACGGSLVNLPPEKRVYILAPAGMPPSPPPEALEPEAAPPEPEAEAPEPEAEAPEPAAAPLKPEAEVPEPEAEILEPAAGAKKARAAKPPKKKPPKP